MRRVNYPTGKIEITGFNSRYLATLKKVNIPKIDWHLANASPYNGKPLTFAQLAVMPFVELLNVKTILADYADSRNQVVGTKKNGDPIIENDFMSLFSYDDNDEYLAKFFTSEKVLNLKVCHYCGIDYINAFKNFGDYLGPIDFLNRADSADLKFIHRLGDTTADFIIKYRSHKKIKSINDIKLNSDIKTAILSFNFNDTHSHFTLDHVFPKGKYNFFSLCLYNLVPSCYSCNSKFKHIREFVIDRDITRVSPTSSLYSISEDFRFEIRYSGLLKDIRTATDFAIHLAPVANFKQLDNYIKIFKLNGRYAFHKDEILELIRNKILNPKSEIVKKAKMLRMSPLDLEKIIHGKEIFKAESSNPMHKFKRDIAKSIKIIT